MVITSLHYFFPFFIGVAGIIYGGIEFNYGFGTKARAFGLFIGLLSFALAIFSLYSLDPAFFCRQFNFC